jgi:hypothetical protein
LVQIKGESLKTVGMPKLPHVLPYKLKSFMSQHCYQWQKVETKQKIILELVSNAMPVDGIVWKKQCKTKVFSIHTYYLLTQTRNNLISKVHNLEKFICVS